MPTRRRPTPAGDLVAATSIDFLILADKAQALDGKLYMLGGGFDRISSDLSSPVPFSVAVGVLVPWGETNRPHSLQITLEDEDSRALQSLQAEFRVGRPPHALEGQSFRNILVVDGLWQFDRYGTYRVVAALAERETKTAVVHVLPALHSPAPPPR